MGRSFDGSRAGCIARLIAEDFYRDGLDLASRNMGHQGERSADADDRLGRAPPGSRAGGQTWLGIPEVAAARTIRSSGGADDRVVRRFLTFIGAMDRARNATQLWNAGLSLFLDSPQIFDPQHASGIDFDALQQLPRINRVSRKHRPDTRAWLGIAASLVDSRLSPVQRVIDNGHGDVHELLPDVKTRDERGHSRFPMLRGPKVGPMWIRMMVNPSRPVIDRIETIPAAVDVQVRRATENLGATATRGLPLRRTKPVIHQAWMEAVSEVDIGEPPGLARTYAALDPALWFLGRHGCDHCEKADRKVRFGRRRFAPPQPKQSSVAQLAVPAGTTGEPVPRPRHVYPDEAPGGGQSCPSKEGE